MPSPTASPLHRAARAALVLSLAQVTACMTWHPVPGTLEQQVGAEPIARARLQLRDGSELSLRDVTVRSDSVIGYSDKSHERRARPVADVVSIDRRGVSVGKTTALVGASALALFAAFAAMAVAAGPWAFE